MEIVIQWGKLTFCMCMCVVVGGTGVKTWWVSMVFPGVGIGEGGGVTPTSQKIFQGFY